MRLVPAAEKITAWLNPFSASQMAKADASIIIVDAREKAFSREGMPP